MSDASLNDLLAELNGGSNDEATAEAPKDEASAGDLESLLGNDEEVKDEAKPETAKPETAKPDDAKAEDPLAGLLVGEKEEPQPEPVKKPRGRPKGSTKAKTAAAKKAEEPAAAEAPTPVVTDEAPQPAPVVEPDNSTPSANGIVIDNVDSLTSFTIGKAVEDSLAPKSRDIYLVADSQILNGHVYRKGQKITFTKGDKFYRSQTDRNGNNWLDHVDDPDYQWSYFGRIVVRPDNWEGTPFGSTEGITNPALILAIAQIAQEEYKRNGVPYN